ncbi:hypothetical protein B9G38_13270 [Halorubrum sp. SD612]|nr:hypothetical protein B9G38_13270 [Halorubrum sp. SD612]
MRSVVRDAFGVSSSRKSKIFGRQRACARLGAGALAVFAADLRSDIYKRAAGALAVFVIRPRPTVYK